MFQVFFLAPLSQDLKFSNNHVNWCSYLKCGGGKFLAILQQEMGNEGEEGGGGVKGKAWPRENDLAHFLLAWHIIQAFGSYSNTTILSYEFKMHSVLALRFRGINQKTGTLLQQIYREDWF